MPRTAFEPARHGFHFANYFTNYVLPGIVTEGRCGGMTYAALDAFTSGVPIPSAQARATNGQDLASWDGERLDLFARGDDNQLWHRWFWRNGWANWEPLGGEITSDPAAVSWGSARVDAFARGTDNALWHRWFGSGIWNDWESLGGELASGPDACSWGPGRIDVFASGTDNALWHRRFENGWGDWESLGGKITSDPAAVAWGWGRIDVFARGDDNALWHRWYDTDWSDWESLGGELVGGPDVASWGDRHLDVFVRGTDDALWHKWFDGSWSNWESLNGSLSSDPTADARRHSVIDVIYRGSDQNLWRLTYDGRWLPQRRLDQDVPVDGQALSDYLYRRQIDSLWSVVPGYGGRLLPLLHSDEGRFNWSIQEADELGRLRRHIDAGNPVNLAMFGPNARYHQTLAIGYDFSGPNGQLRVTVYDPNWPETEVTLTADAGRHRFTTNVGEEWIGYFVDEGYSPVRPTF